MVDSNNQNNLSFLLRPPVDEEEVNAAAPHIHNVINTAYDILQTKGKSALLEHINEQIKITGKYHDSLSVDDNENDDDESSSNDDQSSFYEAAKINADPRPYQIAMFERVKVANTIVQLHTGLGKTMIAIMTMKHFAQDFSLCNSKGHYKQTWFLVPTVALAVQQAMILKANLPYEVVTACNSGCSSSKVITQISNAKIVVLTHGSAIELLQHYGDEFYFERVNLLVVDECHHAIKKHNYVNIFDHFYHTIENKESRPRVLGLTATPIINVSKKDTSKQKLEQHLRQLETTLDSNVIGFDSLGLSIEESGITRNNVTEMSVFYENPPIDASSFPTHDRLHKSRKKELSNLLYLLEEYGSVVVWKYLEALIQEISRNFYLKETEEEFQALRSHLRTIQDYCKRQTDCTGGKTAKLIKLEKLLREFYHIGFDGKPEFDNTIGIVFVQRRVSAVCLKHYFSSKNEMQANGVHGASAKCIRSDFLNRDTTQIFKYTSSVNKMNTSQDDFNEEKLLEEWLHRTQDTRKILNKLQSREINLLFATAVVEEGIDIDACSFVIVLDQLQTTKMYVQMKGRARAMNSKFVVFENIHEDSQGPPLTLEDAINIDKAVTSYLGTRDANVLYPTNKVATGMVYSNILCVESPKINLSHSEESALRDGCFKAKDGMVNLVSAKSLVERYCSCIPMDLNARTSYATMSPYRPVYQGSTLKLPSHLPPNIRTILLPAHFVSTSKRKNESYLALIACVRLYEHKVLNERLLPLKRSDITKMFQKAVYESHKHFHITSYSINVPNSAREGVFYIYPIIQKGNAFEQNMKLVQNSSSLCRQLGIVSSTMLESASRLSLCMFHKQLGLIHCSLASPMKMTIDAKGWKICQQFFVILMNLRWRRKTSGLHFRFKESYDCVFPPYIVSCLTGTAKLDFEYMHGIICQCKRSKSERKLAVQNWTERQPRLVSPLYDPNNIYIAYETAPKKDCSHAFPDAKYKSFAEYYLQKKEFHVPLDGKLLRVQRSWDLPTSYEVYQNKCDIQDSHEIKDDGFNHCLGLTTLYLPKDGVLESLVADPQLLLLSIMVPQVLYQLERMETVQNFMRHCSRWPHLYKCLSEKIQIDEITMALTAKSCSLGRFSYDRLEYLGDAVLKVIHTDALINPADKELKKWFHCLHEGDLSQLRTELGCNSRLSKISKSAGIDSFILTRPLGRGTWLPSCLEIYIVTDKPNINDVMPTIIDFSPSEKVVADVMESLLGLIYMNCGYEDATKVACELDLSPQQSNETFHQLNIPEDHFVDENFIVKAKSFLGVEMLNKYFVMEAITHPTKTGFSNYQRLEWIGDAILCLASREWIFHKFESQLDVKSMVMIETILICNETLSMISFTSGLQRFLNHCDASLIGRLESYKSQLQNQKQNLWSTDPPKVLADIVEALIGVAHVDGGLKQGQLAARNAISSMISAIGEHFNEENTINEENLLLIANPLHSIKEICPEVKIRGYDMIEYKRHFCSPVFFKNTWRNASENAVYESYVGQISIHRLNLCSYIDQSSRNIAKAKCSALLCTILGHSEDLKSKLNSIYDALGKKK